MRLRRSAPLRACLGIASLGAIASSTVEGSAQPALTSDAGTLTAADAGAGAGPAAPSSADPSAGDAGAPSPGDAGAPNPAPKDQVTDAGAEGVGSCVERIPEGKNRPSMQQRIAPRSLAGYALTLEVVLEHGKAEKVFPNGFRFDLSKEELSAFEKSGFALPEPDGGAGPELILEELSASTRTTVRLNFVALPTKTGRQTLTLGAVPITIARANGELITLCTQPEQVVVDPPTANTPSPVPRGNPPPRPQREVWENAKLAALTAAIALVVGALVASLLIWLRRRPKPAPPPPPPRPPWEVAMEELHDLRARQLISQARFDEHFDEVCKILRKYLGDRYGIGGALGDAGALESTTEEILRVLSRIVPRIPVLDQVEAFLREADLVKFAKATPDSEQCEAALGAVEQIVLQTVPPRSVPTEARPDAPASRRVE